ncbi:class I SAM-dependent methyltransferase [Nocardia otitidiscaviarum]|uniref:class I SAM-dependent methyltransferase n=1 Tax=Nocardia otitidiscaviarum TaxID=1823 RepID=UPI001895B45E|nr:class I SAM-dependent methyltransferase [Nocardia otitidiscaviarum]MBF6183410.1 class I SAM-dependent methyltransferase [Nocardia otitidiscaviarum]
MAYEHPLAYVLGVEGAALLRAFAGEYDRAFTEARIEEVRRLLNDPVLAAGVAVDHLDSVVGYGIWSRAYDDPGNPAFGYDEGIVRAVAASAARGVALDAACGTGRVAAVLAEYGHRVIGVDSSPEMLDIARKRSAEVDFRLGEVAGLPVETDTVDIVTCSLALTHLRELGEAFGEFARVLRPGGQLVIADVHPELVARTHIPTVRLPDGTPARVRSYRHRTGDYLRAALAAGFTARRCEEPRPRRVAADATPTAEPGPWDAWPWSLTGLVPEAVRAADTDVPAMLLWHFELTGP